MLVRLHFTCEEHAYYISGHLNLDINSLSEKGESNLDPKEIKTSLRGKRVNTLNKRVKSEECMSS
jgi:hypothetical protein